VSEKEPVRIVELRPPTQCVLWPHPERAAGKFSGFMDEVETFEDTGHLTRSLYKCRECGQLYFHEWYEWVDWKEGNDKMYDTLIPVQTQAEIDALKETDTFMLMTFFPRLQLDGHAPVWVGR